MPAVRTAHPRVLVIGASRGLGRAIVDEYLRRGAHVVATVRRPDQASLDGAEDATADGRLRLEHVDITDPAAVDALRDRLAGERFDLLFVVAGVTNERADTPATVTTDEFIRVMVTNALSPMRTVEALSPLVPAGGTIAVMSSGQGSIANNRKGDFEIYRASKSALNQLMRSYAAREHDRTLLLMAPGWVQTELGGSGAALTVDESVPGVVSTIDAQHGVSGLQFLDYAGRTVPW